MVRVRVMVRITADFGVQAKDFQHFSGSEFPHKDGEPLAQSDIVMSVVAPLY